MALLSAQHEELQRFVDKWCKQQEDCLHSLFHKQQSSLEAPANAELCNISSPKLTTSSSTTSEAAKHERRKGSLLSLISDTSFEASGATDHNDVHESVGAAKSGASVSLAVGNLQSQEFTASESRISKAASSRSRELKSTWSKVSFYEKNNDSDDDQPKPRPVSQGSRKSRRSFSSGSSGWIAKTFSTAEDNGTLSAPVRRHLKRKNATKRLSTNSMALQRMLTMDHESHRIAGTRRCLSVIIHGGRFESMIAVVIMFNAALMSVQANYEMQNLSSPSHPAVDRIELALCIIYAVELLLRLFVHGSSYFLDANWRWNWFDMFLVVLSIYDQIITAISVEGPMFNLSFFRMLRLLKMLKLLRMIRLMKFFKELRLILYAVMGCVQAMFWACVLIAIISYVAGILFVQACAQYLKEAEAAASPWSRELIQHYWVDVGTAMLSLFKACTAGKEWVHIASPLEEAGALWYGVFVAYIAFFAFVIMNTLTSLFVDTVMDHSQKDLEMVIQLELDKKGEYINMLRNFFQAMDSHNSGVVTYEDFEKHLDNPIIQGFAATMEIDIMNARKFFRILSHDGTREVDVETFVVGCIKLKGNARSVDLIEHAYTFKKFTSDQALVTAETASRLQTLERTLREFLIQTEFLLRKPPPNLQEHDPSLVSM